MKDGSRLYVPKASLDAYAEAEQAAAERAAGWQGLADLRVLFPIPELEARRRRVREEREAAQSATDLDEEKKR